MLRCLWGALVALALILGSVVPAGAQTSVPCGKRQVIVDELDRGYGEKPVAIGLSGDGLVIEIFASDSGTFTILVTRPGGPSCVVAAGEGWESRSAEAPRSSI